MRPPKVREQPRSSDANREGQRPFRKGQRPSQNLKKTEANPEFDNAHVIKLQLPKHQSQTPPAWLPLHPHNSTYVAMQLSMIKHQNPEGDYLGLKPSLNRFEAPASIRRPCARTTRTDPDSLLCLHCLHLQLMELSFDIVRE